MTERVREFVEQLRSNNVAWVSDVVEAHGEITVIVPREAIVPVSAFLRDDPDLRTALLRIVPTELFGASLLVLAGFLEGNERIAVWVIALAIDYLGPVVNHCARLRAAAHPRQADEQSDQKARE